MKMDDFVREQKAQHESGAAGYVVTITSMDEDTIKPKANYFDSKVSKAGPPTAHRLRTKAKSIVLASNQ